MWFKKASPRRQAIREDLAELRLSNPTRGRARQLALIMLTFGILAAALQFWPRNPLPYRVGEKAPIPIRAVVRFPFKDPLVAAEDRRNTSYVIGVDEEVARQIKTELVSLRATVETLNSVDEVPPKIREHLPSLNADTFKSLKGEDQQTFTDSVSSFVTDSEKGLRAAYIVSSDDLATFRKHQEDTSLKDSRNYVQPAPANIIEKVESRAKPWPVYKLIECGPNGVDPARRPEILESFIESNLLSKLQSELATDVVMNLTRPLYRYDPRLSELLADENANSGGEEIAAGSIIVDADAEITSAKYEELKQSQLAWEKHVAQVQPWAPWVNRMGLIFTAFLLTAAGAFYISRSAPIMTIRRVWAIAGLLWITLAAAKVMAVYWPIGVLAITPTLLVAIILVIAENPRFSLGVSALHGLLVTFTIRQGIDFYIPLLAGVAIFCFGLREIRTRGKLIEVGAAAGLGIFVAVWAVGASRILGLGWSRWIGATDIRLTWNDSLWGAGAGVAVAMFALAILPSVERIFKITTAMTLLELCDANRPLLRRLSQEAPGTFNHSLTVGIMAEAAGNAIGANGLLCRVGAYYHDVGKLSKPQYFIENQNAGHPNRHDKLSPAMSLLIIVGHVKDGIELAREYSLPWVVHQFIAQHHGTTLVEYFFHAARKRAEKSDAPVVSETEFRYPGPKPQTPEAAIVMICDSCESVVRSIDEPTPGRIEAAVHNMIMKRLLDSQFSECDLTLRDLSIIEETLVRTLAGVHHGRVSYPGRSEDSGPEIELSQPA